MSLALKESVGKAGKNLEADVKIVQTLLNEKFLKPNKATLLKVDGKMGPKTQGAIETYQKKAVGLLNPDCRIDPGGLTFRKLLGLATVAKVVEFEALPVSGAGYYCYSPPVNQFGTKKTIEAIRRIAANMKSIHKLEIAIGDISLKQGGRMPKHESHQRGIDVDVRPLRTDRRRDPVTYTDRFYDQAATAKLVEIARRDPALDYIFFNDPKMSGVKSCNGHHNHLHMRFKS